jgi:hypothetical protein
MGFLDSIKTNQNIEQKGIRGLGKGFMAGGKPSTLSGVVEFL